MHAREKCQLPLRRKSGLWFVEQIQSVADSVLNNFKKRFAVRARVERASTVMRIWVAKEVRVGVALV